MVWGLFILFAAIAIGAVLGTVLFYSATGTKLPLSLHVRKKNVAKVRSGHNADAENRSATIRSNPATSQAPAQHEPSGPILSVCPFA